MSIIPPGENIIETKTCLISGEQFHVTDKDIELLQKMSPMVDETRLPLPSPTLHPDVRMGRRLNFRNEMNLYNRKCSKTGKDIISIYSSDKPYTVYAQSEWWSDNWDRFAYGFSFDDNASFFKQYDRLLQNIPMLGSTVVASENCEYNNDTGESKNCYLCYRTHYCEDCQYSYRANRSQNCCDCYQVKVSSYLYECFQCEECHRGWFLFNCYKCSDACFLWNCTNTKDCFMCWNLDGDQYKILNIQYTKEEYHEKISKYGKWTTKTLEEARSYFFSQVKKHQTHGPSIIESEGCFGDDLFRCQNCVATFMMKDCSGCRYAWDNIGFRDCMDNYSAKGSELCYETTASKGAYMTHFCVRTKDCRDCMYCMFCFNCQNCFGCYGLQGKSYCIFNKQYSQKEYTQELKRIIGHMTTTGEWGEFFPHHISPFGYNESAAGEYFPLEKEEVLKRNWKWKNEEGSSVTGFTYDPQEISQYNESIVGKELATKNIQECLKGPLKCVTTGKAFRLTSGELAFYIQNNLPIPQKSPQERHKDRIQFRKPRGVSYLATI